MLSKVKCLTHEQSEGTMVAGGRAQHSGWEPKVSGSNSRCSSLLGGQTSVPRVPTTPIPPHVQAEAAWNGNEKAGAEKGP